jgi:hypothetical protein
MATLNKMNTFNCQHDQSISPISYWCTGDSCWEACGMSSRFIEHYMKQIKAIGRIDDCVPHDSQDFGRCVAILNKHPEWLTRLPELKKINTNWKRLITYWDNFMIQYNELPHIKTPNKNYSDYTESDKCKYEYFDYQIKGIQKNFGMLRTYKIDNNVKHKLIENLIVGSHVLQEKNQEDEFDLYPCVIVDIYPNIWCNILKENGKNGGLKHAKSFLQTNQQNENTEHVNDQTETNNQINEQTNEQTNELNPIKLENKIVKIIDSIISEKTVTETDKVTEKPVVTVRWNKFPIEDTPEFRKNELIKKLHTKMEEYVKSDPDTWSTTNFHYCPHYKLYSNNHEDELESEYEMFVADIYPLNVIDDEWRLGMCIISITKSHELHPSKKMVDEHEIEYNGANWVVSSDPVKLYSYYEDGLINCFSSNEEETLSESEIEKIIKGNIIKNNELIEKENKVNSTSNPLKSVGFCRILCN